MIKHYPITNTETVIKYYAQKDGLPIKYICTTDFGASDRPVDIFYRDSPHPEFGNKYFGIAPSYESDDFVIFNADKVEDFTFGMVEDDDGNLQYSEYHHRCKFFENGNMIDGGREYVRSSLNAKIYVVRNGEMVSKDE
jgi:hypothetical protein